ncbi:MAG: GNAT family N-acetyltransferase, partial [Pseudomonadota bacterium]
QFDGTWAMRLCAGHPAKRLNSVNPLDPADMYSIEARTLRVQRKFEAFGRPLVFRHSPLAPAALDKLFDNQGWRRFDETRVMRLNLQAGARIDGVMQLPLKDTRRWIEQSIAMGGFGATERAGMAELIGLSQGKVGLFLLEEDDGTPLAACMAVKFGEFLGLFEVVSNPAHRGQGYGRRIVESALLWGFKQGARTAWLQVVADNQAACGLYQSLGFEDVYRYHYRGA